jgi:type I restriction enzyme S subunit
LARKGDILMSLTGTLGKRDYGYAILVEDEDRLMVNQRVALIKANEDMSIEFSINIFHCELYLNQLYKIPTGTKQGNLSCDDVLSISMAIPSTEEQSKIGEYLKRKSNEIDTIVSKTQQEIELLKEYKTALISEVVTGKVDVRDVVLN